MSVLGGGVWESYKFKFILKSPSNANLWRKILCRSNEKFFSTWIWIYGSNKNRTSRFELKKIWMYYSILENMYRKLKVHQLAYSVFLFCAAWYGIFMSLLASKRRYWSQTRAEQQPNKMKKIEHACVDDVISCPELECGSLKSFFLLALSEQYKRWAKKQRVSSFRE